MTQDDTITPFIDLVKQWSDDWHKAKDNDFDLVVYVALQATRWGADQELEACCEWLREAKNHGFGYDYGAELARKLRADRRPKPPSLKEQALKALKNIDDVCESEEFSLPDDTDIIRRALESLPD